MDDLSPLLTEIIALSKKAGEAILPFYQHDHLLDIKHKVDQSPVTEGDLAAHAVIEAGLKQLIPDWPLLSEEGDLPDFAVRQQWQRYWLCDPLDGTRGFINGSTEFSVNIALIENHQAIMGVIYAPVTEILYYGLQHHGSFQQKAKGDLQRMYYRAPKNKFRILVGQYHRSKWSQKLEKRVPNLERISLNSSLKFGAIAACEGDIYPRFGVTCEWDTAAGQIILEEAGGAVVDFKGKPLQYNAKDSLENPEFLALGDASKVNEVINLLNEVRSSS